ncbi:MAG: sigma-54-dependent Fis family transcriptional regulator [Acidobacteria bacterium]|nr:sigma-54-dependent Fis family transcriptional regulator [Acidobacteriota bacterium]MCZ6650037.1 sigma-54-dependent Fis family transcriptional regulator [Acidobacteriota bacterium]MCZ6746204.1 sigma-54-dependent Fis family transcriptional regulator [Acidobacteriota bacterium]
MATNHDKLGALFLKAISEVLRQAVEPDRVLALILDQAVTLTGADRGAFIEVGQGGAFTYRVLHRFTRRHAAGAAGAYSRSLFVHVLESGQGILVPNAMEDERFMENESIQNLRIVSILCQPQFVEEKVCGILYLESNKTGHFTGEHQALLEDLGHFSAQALAALKAGRDLIEERNRLRAKEGQIRREVEESRTLLSGDWHFGRFIGRSEAVRRLEKSVTHAARSDFPVLLTGETGTGKNLLARVIHHGGRQRDGKFVHLACPSLEPGTVESTLFGHRKGAFTGADQDRIGKIQDAEGGTLFLDEISSLPGSLQPKLLRLLEEKTYEPVGDHRERCADLRFITSTNQDLDALVQQGRFRQDLFHRLNFLAIRLPPLRERREDIPLLLRHFLDQGEARGDHSLRWLEITNEAVCYLMEADYHWPGNVRQVQQLAARLAVDEEVEQVCVNTMKRALEDLTRQSGGVYWKADGGTSLTGAIKEAERETMERILKEHPDLTRIRQAELLGVSESKFYKMLRKFDFS